MKKAILVLGSLFCAFGGTTPAFAEDAPLAEILFQEGRRLLAEGDLVQACDKLAESSRIDPGVGVLLYLADCYERRGMLATAWATFHEAIPPSRKSGQREREETAVARAAALEPRLPKIILVPPADAPEGLTVERGGAELRRASFALPIPVDPGTVELEVRAPGFISKKLSVKTEEGVVTRVELPTLRRAPKEDVTPNKQPAKQTDAAPASWSTLHTVGVVSLGLGGVGLAVGAGLGAAAMSDWSAVEDRCVAQASGLVCDDEGVERASSADAKAWGSTGAFIAGGALAATGAVLLGLAFLNGDEQEQVTAVVVPMPQGALVMLGGSF